MKHSILYPCIGACVGCASRDFGIVKAVDKGLDDPTCHVKWLPSKRLESIAIKELRSGFKLGMEVKDVPASFTRKSLGEGVIIENRTLGGRDQSLVGFYECGRQIWVPFQNLRKIVSVEEKFKLEKISKEGHGEKFRLRSLAHAIELWHENTGGLSRLDIDPLPHQIHLVHHILASGNLNWLIADDVGLGKTIEVGMLLSALIKRGTHKRILLITPAGLVKQWQEELSSKFGLNEFRIYGEDFNINESRHWKLHDHVIGSIDRLKSEEHLGNLLKAEPWDLVVFDEAHRLSRVQYGMKRDASERFRLAAKLRTKTDSVLLLTATPHQGKKDKFQALLEIIRPDMKEKISRLDEHRELLHDMVIRNKKAEVIDAEGNFIFQGKTSYQIPVPLNAKELEFDKSLRKYLLEGYTAMAADGTPTGRAIGFVLTTYRKLAASSIAAIGAALRRRLEMLLQHSDTNQFFQNDNEETDERYFGEWEEKVVKNERKQFFKGEVAMLQDLIAKAGDLYTEDSKIKLFLTKILSEILERNSIEKIVIFSEYRGTQEYIAEAIREQYGKESVSVLHGGLGLHERELAIAHFEDTGQFLISTEAGGEGINLHRQCHMMVNYDLPWNPMRLVQRVGRLYRYGQKKKVVVFNMNVTGSMDGHVLNTLYHRIDQVVGDLAGVGNDFHPGLEAEILGELADALDIEDILEKAGSLSISHSERNIEEALIRAKDAVKKQRELLEHAAGYNEDARSGELRLSLEHVKAFVVGMIKELGIEIIEMTHKESVFKIKLPNNISEKIGMAGQILHVTLDRDVASRRKDFHMLDLHSPLLRHMIEYAKSYTFDGRMAFISGLSGQAVMSAILSWQNDQGKRMRQEYSVAVINDDGMIELNPLDYSEWLKSPAKDGDQCDIDGKSRKILYDTALSAFDCKMGETSNSNLHPENCRLINGALM